MVGFFFFTYLSVFRFVLISSGPELTLEKVTREVAGTYKCRADNGVETPQYRTFQLRVSCESESQYQVNISGPGPDVANTEW